MIAGDIVVVDFWVPMGSEPGFVRPAVVVTANMILSRLPRTVHVVPLTTNLKRSLTSEVRVDFPDLHNESAAQCHLSQTVSTARISNEPIGNVGSVILAQIRSVLSEVLDLD
jgi:mRNA-degrading endonuclease toxin of MazEF toxin-antitoxin module